MKNAVIIIDVQESFRSHESWATISPPDIAERCNALVNAARSRGDLIVWVLPTAPGSKGPFDMDSGHVASICAGSLALAEIGILRGQTATTHHGLLPYLAAYPKVSVAADVLFTCAPRLHTSAGIASGIDLSLHLVAHDLGPAVAAKVARTLVVPAWRPGSATRHSVTLMHRDHMDDLAHRAQDILDDVEHDPGTLGQIAQRLGVSSRTLSRHFVAATGMTPNVYLSAIRAERATQLHDAGWSWDEAARAVGYANARSLRSRS